jgi:hypothetical protein
LATYTAIDQFPGAPRNVRVRSAAQAGRIFLWILLLSCLIIGPLWAMSTVGRLDKLKHTGKVLDADITDSSVTQGKSKTYHMTVDFSVGNDSVEQRRVVPEEVYQSYVNQPKIPVTVMPGDPNDFEIGAVTDEIVSGKRTNWTLGVLAFIGLAAIFVLAFELSLSFERRLLTSGQAVEGRVLSATVVKGKATTTTVSYSYATEFGERAGSSTLNGDMTVAFSPGRPMIVLYLKNDDRKSRPYQFFSMVDLVA